MRLPDDLILKSSGLRDQYFDLRGLSVYSSLSVSTLRDHIQKCGLPAYQLHGKILVRKSDFDSWISRFKMTPSMDLNKVVDEIISEIGEGSRKS